MQTPQASLDIRFIRCCRASGRPVGVFAFCDLLYLGGAEAEIWSRLALYTMVGGFIGAFTAVALPGFVAHMNVTLVVVALYAVNIWLRLGDPHLAMAIALSVIGVGMLAVSSWLGGAMVRVPERNEQELPSRAGHRVLARESQVPVDEVARLYDDARAELEAGARIGVFSAFCHPQCPQGAASRQAPGERSRPVHRLRGVGGVADAGLLSSTGPVIAILDGELLVGEVTAHFAGWGTIALRSPSNPGLTCAGESSATDALGDAGQLRCSDGATAAFQFQRLSLRRGYGAGTSGSALSFTYGLTAEESAPYLKLPCGKGAQGRRQQPRARRRRPDPAPLSYEETVMNKDQVKGRIKKRKVKSGNWRA